MAEVGLTQTERLRAFIEANPHCSILEITFGLHPFVANPRARISDLRAEANRSGTFRVVKAKRKDGRDGYSVEPIGPMTLGLSA